MYTSHGHHIDGTVKEDSTALKVYRCGGPGLCRRCSEEAAMVANKDAPIVHTVDISVRTIRFEEHNRHDTVKALGTVRSMMTGISIDRLQIHIKDGGYWWRSKTPDAEVWNDDSEFWMPVQYGDILVQMPGGSWCVCKDVSLEDQE